MTSPIAPATAGTSTRPYLIRALHDWCTDNGFTPYIAVFVDEHVQVPKEYVKNNEIVLNVGFEATSALKLGNELIEFKARFGGTSREIVGADRPRDRDLRARERPGHGLPDADRRGSGDADGGKPDAPRRAARAAPGRAAGAPARKGGTALTLSPSPRARRRDRHAEPPPMRRRRASRRPEAAVAEARQVAARAARRHAEPRPILPRPARAPAARRPRRLSSVGRAPAL